MLFWNCLYTFTLHKTVGASRQPTGTGVASCVCIVVSGNPKCLEIMRIYIVGLHSKLQWNIFLIFLTCALPANILFMQRNTCLHNHLLCSRIESLEVGWWAKSLFCSHFVSMNQATSCFFFFLFSSHHHFCLLVSRIWI